MLLSPPPASARPIRHSAFGLLHYARRRPALSASLLLALSATSLSAAPPATWLISDHGAVADGQTVNTPAIQSAIDQLSAAGGGTLVVPQGTFLSGALYFKPGVNLRVDRDGILKSTTTMAGFPPIYTRWEGIERYWTSAFLNFVGLDHVEVTGEGVIDGSGDAWASFGQNARGRGPRAGAPGSPGAAMPPTGVVATADARGPGRGPPPPPAPPGPLPKPADVFPSPLPSTATISLAADRTNIPVINAAGLLLPRGGGPMSPPRAIVFQNCTHVRIAGLTLKNQARWGYVFIYCDDVVAEKLTARAEHYIPSSDSMDIDSCRRVLVTGGDFDCNDDCISIKSGKDEDGRRVNRPCEDIVIEKTRFAYGHGGTAIGSETSGGIRRVETRDCVVEAGNWAPIRFKTQPSRGGVVEDITYRNIEIRDAHQAFEFDLEWNMRINVAGDVRVPPTVRHVKLINVHGAANAVGKIHGLKDSFIDGVTFEHCSITAQRGLVIDNARNVDTSGLELKVAEGDPIIRR